MKKNRIILAIIALMVALTTAQARSYSYETVAGDPMQTRIYTLDNGLKVYMSVYKEKPRIQTFIAVKTGSRNDPAETTGLAHYLEHLMFKGTQKYGTSDPVAEAPHLQKIKDLYEQYRKLTDPAQRAAKYREIDSVSQIAARYNIPNEYDKLMASIGAEGSNAYTSFDVTCYTEDIPSNEVENWARIESDRFKNMVIRGFHTELEAVYEEYNISLANDGEKAADAMFAKLFPGHPYGTQTTIGTQEHLKNPSIVNIENYFHRYYCPNNVAICLSGDLDPDRTIAIIDQYFGSWERNASLSYPQYAPVAKLKTPVDTAVVGQEAEFIMLAWQFDKAASLQADTLEVMAQMLNNGTAGLMDLDLSQQMQWLGGGCGNYNLAEYSLFLCEGMPKSGQSLEELKGLLLGEIEKLKQGDFSDDLLPSVINNMKRNYYASLQNNRSRANYYVDAFINGTDWNSTVHRLDRMAGMTKQQIMDFARRHLDNGYVAVYKRMGEDTTQKKIDKPAITPIPANREMQSDFMAEITGSKVDPIQPRFLDYDKDIQKATSRKGLPVLYVPNNDNGLFQLSYYYEMGTEVDKWLPFAADYINYLGTDKLSAQEVQQQFYKLACDYRISVDNRALSISLQGLDENMPQAVALLEEVLAHAKADQDAYNMMVGLAEKSRDDAKLNQRENFSRLINYGIYGPYNSSTNIPTNAELEAKNPQECVDMISNLANYQHTVLYCGPTELKKFIGIIDKIHRCGKKLQAVPEGRRYTMQQTAETEIYLAPYEAKNIYMRQYHCSAEPWQPSHEPVVRLFNEYFGGGMNTVVFQELRETRGLAYNALAFYGTPSYSYEPEYAMTHIISQNDKMMDCIHTFNNIVDTIPQSQQAFDLAKQSLMKQLASNRTTRMNIIYSYLAAKNLGIDYDINRTVYEALPSITMQDLVDFERQSMASKPYRYLILGDESNLDMPALQKIAPIQRLTTQDIFGY